MSFEFSDLNAQLTPGLEARQCVAFTTQTICLCLSSPPTYHCRCLSNFVTVYCRYPHSVCQCFSKPILTIPCICLSKPIVTGLPPTIRDFTIYEHVAEVTRQVGHPSELDLLRAELNDAIKHLDVQKEAFDRTGASRSDDVLDAAEAQLKQQLELLQKQRAGSRKPTAGKSAQRK